MRRSTGGIETVSLGGGSDEGPPAVRPPVPEENIRQPAESGAKAPPGSGAHRDESGARSPSASGPRREPRSNEQQYSDPVSPQVAEWCNGLGRALKGVRLYPGNNSVVRGYLEHTMTGLETLLRQRRFALELRVREDRFYFGQDVVYVDPSRDDGLPFTLFRNSIQRVEFAPGITVAELEAFIQSIANALSPEQQIAGEDLVTALWRCDFPNLSYTVLDVFSIATRPGEFAGRGGSGHLDDETRRLRSDLDSIVFAVRERQRSPGVEGALSMNAGALSTPTANPTFADLAKTDDRHLAPLLDSIQVPAHAYASFTAEWEQKDLHEALASRLLELLLAALRAEGVSDESTPAWQLFTILFDGILQGQRFQSAVGFVERLTRLQRETNQPADIQLAERVLSRLRSPACFAPAMKGVAMASSPALASEAVHYIAALGPDAMGNVLEHIDTLEDANALRMVCTMVARIAGHDLLRWIPKIASARWEVSAEFLAVPEQLADAALSALVWLGMEHEHPSVRARALDLLTGYQGGLVDDLIAKAIRDEDANVRSMACRIACQRKNVRASEALANSLKHDDLDNRDPDELKSMAAAYAVIGGAQAIPLLKGILEDSSTLGLRKSTTEMKIGVSYALGIIGTEAAHEVLKSGRRTLNFSVRAACKDALEKPPRVPQQFFGTAVSSALLKQLQARPAILPARAARRRGASMSKPSSSAG